MQYYVWMLPETVSTTISPHPPKRSKDQNPILIATVPRLHYFTQHNVGNHAVQQILSNAYRTVLAKKASRYSHARNCNEDTFFRYQVHGILAPGWWTHRFKEILSTSSIKA